MQITYWVCVLVFVDDLAFLLFTIGTVAALALYTTLCVYLTYKKSKRGDISALLKQSFLPLGILGVYLFIMGLFGQFVWPLPGAYNILFFDPLTALSIILLGFFISIRLGLKLNYIGFFSLLAGLMTIVYGITGYNVGLTLSPIALLGLFVFFGGSGVLAYPASLIVDKIKESGKMPSGVWSLLLVLFWLALLAAALMAYFIAIEAIGPHLTNPP